MLLLDEPENRGITHFRTTTTEAEGKTQIFEIIPWAGNLPQSLRRVEALIFSDEKRHYMPAEYFIVMGKLEDKVVIDMGALRDGFFDSLSHEIACDLTRTIIELSYLRIQKRNMIHGLCTAENETPIAHIAILDTGVVYGVIHNRAATKGFGFVLHSGNEKVFQPFFRER